MEAIQNWFREAFTTPQVKNLEELKSRLPQNISLDVIEREINEKLAKETGYDRIKELIAYE